MMPWSGKNMSICNNVTCLFFLTQTIVDIIQHDALRAIEACIADVRVWMATNRLKKSFLLWITCNNLARPNSNRSLSGNPKSPCRYPASGILWHGLIGISPWAFMWAKSAVWPSGSRGLYSLRQIILEFSLHVAAPSPRQRKNGERQRKFKKRENFM